MFCRLVSIYVVFVVPSFNFFCASFFFVWYSKVFWKCYSVVAAVMVGFCMWELPKMPINLLKMYQAVEMRSLTNHFNGHWALRPNSWRQKKNQKNKKKKIKQHENILKEKLSNNVAKQPSHSKYYTFYSKN